MRLVAVAHPPFVVPADQGLDRETIYPTCLEEVAVGARKREVASKRAGCVPV